VNVIFDLDGTLTDPRQGILACFKYAFDALKVDSPADGVLEEFIGPPLQESFSRIFGPNRQALIKKAIALYRERFAAGGMFENKVYPGIAEVLAELHERGERLFVATVKPRVFAERILEHFGLERFFRAVYGSELNGTSSDKRDLLALLLRAESLSSAESVMIGDRAQDVWAANASGIFSIGVLWGYGSRDELTAAGAELLCEEPPLLTDAVSKVYFRGDVDAGPILPGERLG
jgi:phosphoglycolate phosphatase